MTEDNAKDRIIQRLGIEAGIDPSLARQYVMEGEYAYLTTPAFAEELKVKHSWLLAYLHIEAVPHVYPMKHSGSRAVLGGEFIPRDKLFNPLAGMHGKPEVIEYPEIECEMPQATRRIVSEEGLEVTIVLPAWAAGFALTMARVDPSKRTLSELLRDLIVEHLVKIERGTPNDKHSLTRFLIRAAGFIPRSCDGAKRGRVAVTVGPRYLSALRDGTYGKPNPEIVERRGYQRRMGELLGRDSQPLNEDVQGRSIEELRRLLGNDADADTPGTSSLPDAVE